MADSKAATTTAPGKDAPAAKDGAPAAKKKNLKPIVIIAAAVLLLGGGGAAFFLLRPHPEAAAGDAAAKEKAAEADKAKEAKPFFVEFEPFTSNLKDPEKFLQIKLTFVVGSDKAAESLKDIMPVVRSAIVPVLSSQDSTTIMSSDGKEKLAKQIVDATNQSIADHNLKDKVDAVLITHMIIQ